MDGIPYFSKSTVSQVFLPDIIRAFSSSDICFMIDSYFKLMIDPLFVCDLRIFQLRNFSISQTKDEEGVFHKWGHFLHKLSKMPPKSFRSQSCSIIVIIIVIIVVVDTVIAGKKLEGKIMSVMPFFILAYLNLASGEFIDPLYGNLAGVLVMSAALLVFVGAMAINRRISDIRV